MIEKIIINLDYNQLAFMNFSKFIIDLKNKTACYDLNNSILIYPEDDVDLDLRDVYNFHKKFKELISDEVIALNDDAIEKFNNDFVNLNIEYELQKITDETLNNGFTFYEPCILNKCSVKIEYSDNEKEYSFVNHYPNNWIKFGKILENLVGFDVLNIENLKYLVTELHYDIKQEGVYSKETNKKLNLTQLTFSKGRSGRAGLGDKIDFSNEESKGFINLENDVKEQILVALEKYGVYKWYHEDYLQNVIEMERSGFGGEDWEVKLTFENEITLNFIGHFNFPDTYLHFGKELFKLTGRDFFNVRKFEVVMDYEFVDSLKKYGDMKLNL